MGLFVRTDAIFTVKPNKISFVGNRDVEMNSVFRLCLYFIYIMYKMLIKTSVVIGLIFQRKLTQYGFVCII